MINNIKPILPEEKKEVTSSELENIMEDFKETFRGVMNTEENRNILKEKITNKLMEYIVTDVSGITDWDVKVTGDVEKRTIKIDINPIF